MNNLGNTIPTDFAIRYLFDGNGNSTTLSNNATVTNPIWVKSGIGYQSQCLSWGASTSCTYTSVTYTNSYIWIKASGVWTFTKNSSKVTVTALNGTNGEYYAGLTFFNKTLTESEEQLLKLEGLRKLGYSNIENYPKLMDSIIGYWDFIGTAHNIVDGVLPTVSGATLTTDRFGNSNSSYSFNGSSNYITQTISNPNSWGTNQGSFIINFKTPSTFNSLQGVLVGINESSSYGNILVSIDNTGTQIEVQRGGGNSGNFYFEVSYTFLTNTNYRIIYVRTQTQDLVYVNGVLVGSRTISSNNYTSTGTTLNIGRIGTYNYYKGNIDEVIILSRGISADEVKLFDNLFLQDYIYPTKSYDLLSLKDGLLMQLNGSNNGTTTLYDISGNGINGTVSSTPTYKRQGKVKTVSLTSRSISWTSTAFTTSTCFEKVSGKWILQINPTYITTTGITSGTREITDIRLYNRSLSIKEQEQLKYSKIGNFIY